MKNGFNFFIGALIFLSFSHATATDLNNGKEVNNTCAACHGAFGQGGKKGEYPRLAGQQEKYLIEQLKSFRSRVRINIPMYPYTQERELPDGDIADVAAYLAGIELPTRPPQFKDSDDALTRLTAMEKVMIMPREPGDAAAGEALYQKNCAGCHGKQGEGKSMFPRLEGQYTAYLKKQIDIYRKAERPHDEEAAGQGALQTLSPQDIQNIFAYLTGIGK